MLIVRELRNGDAKVRGHSGIAKRYLNTFASYKMCAMYLSIMLATFMPPS